MIKLRSTPKNLKKEDVISMLELHDMYDAILNQIGKGIAHNYTKTSEVVIDEATGLMWQQTGSDDFMSFGGAENYIDTLNSANFAGFDDWRLPTLEEAMSLMEPDKKNGDLYIDPVFDQTQSWIWTIDPVYGGRRRWVVSFYGGRCGFADVGSYDGFVHAVRSR